MIIDKIKIGNTSYDVGVDYSNVDGTPTKLSDFTNDEGFIDSSALPTKVSDLNNDSGFIDKNVNDLTNYTPSSQTTSQLELVLNSENYKLKGILKDSTGSTIYTSNEIDLPLESVVVSGTYDSQTKEVVLTLVNGSTIRFSIADLVSGLVSSTDLATALANYYTKTETDALLGGKQPSITSTNKLSADLVDDTNATNKFVSASDKTNWNSKQDALTAGTNITIDANNVISASGGGIPVFELEENEGVQSNKPFILETHTEGIYIVNSTYSYSELYIKGRSSDSSPTTIKVLYGSWSKTAFYYNGEYSYEYSGTLLNTFEPGSIEVTGNTSNTFLSLSSGSISKSANSYVLSSGSSFSGSGSNNVNLSKVDLINQPRTISAKKTFTVLPESSVVPTNDNQLVNKKYVDDNAGGGAKVYKLFDYNISVGNVYSYGTSQYTVLKEIYDTIKANATAGENYTTNIVVFAPNAWNTPIMIWQDGYKGMSNFVGGTANSTNNAYASGNMGTIGDYYNVYELYIQFINSGQGSVVLYSNTYSQRYIDASYQPKLLASANSTGHGQVLGIDNTTSYTPTANYHPATKKYVDDSIASAITSALGGNY